jgi:hypothetical protein
VGGTLTEYNEDTSFFRLVVSLRVQEGVTMRGPAPDGATFCSIAETLATARSALIDPAVPVRDPIVLTLSHLSTMQRLLGDATGPVAVAMSLTAHRASSRRLRRMLHLLARASAGDRRGGRLDAGTLRTTLAQQINAHLAIERELLARIDPLLRPAETRALTVRYQRLMVAAAADPRSAEVFGGGRTYGVGQAARVRVARLVGRRRAHTDGAPVRDASGG